MEPPSIYKKTSTISGESTERIDRSSEFGSRRTSLEDLMSIDHGTNPGSYTIDHFSEQLERQSSQMETTSLPETIHTLNKPMPPIMRNQRRTTGANNQLSLSVP
ncbi:hypothetical protein ACFE04_014699 [Oxalis oulophora]